MKQLQFAVGRVLLAAIGAVILLSLGCRTSVDLKRRGTEPSEVSRRV
jgi:hypothetical protein